MQSTDRVLDSQESRSPYAAHIEWTLPIGHRHDWLIGTGATKSERRLVWVAALLGAAMYVWIAVSTPDLRWAWWHYVIGLLIAVDLVAGAVANSLNTVKRLYFGVLPERNPGAHLLQDGRIFTALHIYPLLITGLFPGGNWLWGLLWYGAMILGAVSLHRVPLYLMRPVAMLMFVAAVLVNPLIPAPPGWGWFVPVFAAKLLLAHAVREEPYRP